MAVCTQGLAAVLGGLFVRTVLVKVDVGNLLKHGDGWNLDRR